MLPINVSGSKLKITSSLNFYSKLLLEALFTKIESNGSFMEIIISSYWHLHEFLTTLQGAHWYSCNRLLLLRFSILSKDFLFVFNKIALCVKQSLSTVCRWHSPQIFAKPGFWGSRTLSGTIWGYLKYFSIVWQRTQILTSECLLIVHLMTSVSLQARAASSVLWADGKHHCLLKK